MSETLGVVVPTLNGGWRIGRLVDALRQQERPIDEIVVVDDGSTDDTQAILLGLGVRVVRHERNRGASAARNSGLDATTSTVVAFLDDDCAPDARWSAELLGSYRANVSGVGGRIIPDAGNPYIRRYLRRNNPARPLEVELERSSATLFRLWLYIKRQFFDDDADRVRPVYAFAGGNMSFRRQTLVECGKLDSELFFGGEDTELCRRIIATEPDSELIYNPAAVVTHHYDSRLRTIVRRGWFYGRASGWLYLREPTGLPTILPGPALFILASVALLWKRRPVAALLSPLVLYPSGIYFAAIRGHADSLVDPFMKLLIDGADNVGLIAGFLGGARR